MLFYIILLLAITGFGVLLYSFKTLKYQKAIFLAVSGLTLIIISAIRYDVGFDYSYTYAPMYQNLLKTPITELFNQRHEFGFVLFEYFTSLFTENFQAVFVSTSILCIGLFFIYFYKYSSNPVLSVFLFMTIGYFGCSMNFIRQTIAGAIFLFAIECVRKKKLVPYIILTLIAATFHISALVMLPFYFILRIKITKKVLMIYSGVTLFLLLTSNIYIEIAIKYFFPWYNMNDNYHISAGIPWFYAVIPIAIFIIFFFYSKKFTKSDESNYVYLSCTFFTAFVCVLALKHSVLDRFLLYFEPASLVAIPILISALKSEASWDNYDVSHFSAETINRYKKIDRLLKNATPILIITLTVVYYGITLVIDGPSIVPYKVIFNQPFYADYVDTLKGNNKEQRPIEGDPINSTMPIEGDPITVD